MRLTIGIPTYDDFSGLEMTLQALLLYHDMADTEIIVVDNHPTAERDKNGRTVESKGTRKVRQLCEAAGARYIPMAEPRGTAAPRNRVFAEATGDAVIVCDSHIMLAATALPAVRKYFADPANASDILQGPILSKHRHAGRARPRTMATHYADVWRSHMWGIWAQAWQCLCGQWHFDVGAQVPPEPSLEFGPDGTILATPPQVRRDPLCTFHPLRLGGRDTDAKSCPKCDQALPVGLLYAHHETSLEALGYRRRCWAEDDTQPFAIPGLGLGMFAARRDTWQRLGGFPADMIGFGGGELHLHELFRRAGGLAVCHPLAGWWHRFERGSVPYHAGLWEKVRNYVLWRSWLALPLEPVHDHFTTQQFDSAGNPLEKLNEAQWQHLLADPVGHREWPGQLADAKPAKPKKGQRPQPPASAETVEAIYDWVLTTKRDCISHLPAIRKLASQCDAVVACVKRREWDVAIAAGKPVYHYSHNAEQDPLLDTLGDIRPYNKQDDADSLAVEPIDCDLLVLDTVHSAERLRAELTRWTPRVHRWIAIRGTHAFGERAEKGGGAGLNHAIRELTAAGVWKRVYHEDTQYGLTVLSCLPSERTIDRGVGFELAQLYKSLGINPPENCTCRALEARMNALGADGCRKQEDQLIRAMEENAAKYKWTDSLKAGIKAIGKGLAFKINPLDPLRSCLRIAIERTEADDAAWEARNP